MCLCWNILVSAPEVFTLDELQDENESVFSFECIAHYSNGTWLCNLLYGRQETGLILGLRPANERCRYFVTTTLIGWAQT